MFLVDWLSSDTVVAGLLLLGIAGVWVLLILLARKDRS